MNQYIYLDNLDFFNFSSFIYYVFDAFYRLIKFKSNKYKSKQIW